MIVRETVNGHYQQQHHHYQQQQSVVAVESELLVLKLHPSDSGILACTTPAAHPARITLTVTHQREYTYQFFCFVFYH